MRWLRCGILAAAFLALGCQSDGKRTTAEGKKWAELNKTREEDFIMRQQPDIAEFLTSEIGNYSLEYLQTLEGKVLGPSNRLTSMGILYHPNTNTRIATVTTHLQYKDWEETPYAVEIKLVLSMPPANEGRRSVWRANPTDPALFSEDFSAFLVEAAQKPAQRKVAGLDGFASIPPNQTKFTVTLRSAWPLPYGPARPKGANSGYKQFTVSTLRQARYFVSQIALANKGLEGTITIRPGNPPGDPPTALGVGGGYVFVEGRSEPITYTASGGSSQGERGVRWTISLRSTKPFKEVISPRLKEFVSKEGKGKVTVTEVGESQLNIEFPPDVDFGKAVRAAYERIQKEQDLPIN